MALSGKSWILWCARARSVRQDVRHQPKLGNLGLLCG
jgi:hypothetical protein